MNIVILYDSLMKNILVFTSTFPKFTPWDATPGFVYELSRRLVNQESHISILTPRVPGSKKYEEINGLKIYRYPYFFREKFEKLNDGAILPNLKANKWLYFQVPFLLLFWFIYLIKIIRKEKIDIIHAHWIIPQWLIAILIKKILFPHIQVIITSHGSDIFWLRWSIMNFLKKFTLQWARSITVVSTSIKDKILWLWIDEKKVFVIPMGTDITNFNPSKYEEGLKQKYDITWIFLLFVWRLTEVKWLIYLIQAIPKILIRHPSLKLLIVGDWPQRKELEKLVNSLWIEKSIIFVGAINHEKLPHYFATADVFIWPSIHASDGTEEWFWLTFVESILSGTKTIWTKIQWIMDIIEEWKTGFLVIEKDSDALADKILEVIDDTAFDMQKARNIIENKFSWDIIGEKYRKILLRI